MRSVSALSFMVLCLCASSASAQSLLEPPSVPKASDYLSGAGSSAAPAASNTFAGNSSMYAQVSGIYVDPDSNPLTSRDSLIGPIPSDMEFSGGWGVLAAFGMEFNSVEKTLEKDPIFVLSPRFELEAGFRSLSNSTQIIGLPDDNINDDPILFTFSINALVDFNIRGPVDPYIGAGVGFTYIEFDATEDDDHHHHHGSHHYHYDDSSNDTVGHYQLMGGINFRLSDFTTLYGGVRYYETDTANIDALRFKVTATEFEFGIRATFN